MAAEYALLQSANGKYHFNLKAANGEIILASQMYSSAGAMENGIESVKKNGPVAGIDDQTG